MKHLTILLFLFSFSICQAQTVANYTEKTVPLYVIKHGDKTHILDYNEESLDVISPNDISSINVLKGNSAITAYGESGKNGVVIIKLKNDQFFDGVRNTSGNAISIRETEEGLKQKRSGIVITTPKEKGVLSMDLNIQEDEIRIHGKDYDKTAVEFRINLAGKTYQATSETLKDIDVNAITSVSVTKDKKELKKNNISDKIGLVLIELESNTATKALVKDLKQVNEKK